MTMALTFSRQNKAGSRPRTDWYEENLILVLILVS